MRRQPPLPYAVAASPYGAASVVPAPARGSTTPGASRAAGLFCSATRRWRSEEGGGAGSREQAASRRRERRADARYGARRWPAGLRTGRGVAARGAADKLHHGGAGLPRVRADDSDPAIMANGEAAPSRVASGPPEITPIPAQFA
jgi:hypothetical protein